MLFQPGREGESALWAEGPRNGVPALHEERQKAILLQEAYHKIKVNDGDSQLALPMAQTIIDKKRPR